MNTTPVPLPGIPNFRDIGGHPTGHGWRVRTGLLYRSVALSRADEADIEGLSGLGITTVFDLRTRLERDRHPDRLPDGMELVALDVLAGSGESDPAALFELMQDPPRASAEMANGGTQRFYLAAYHDMIRLPSARAAYRQLYLALARQDAQAALIHCTTGKDRTGWAVAALLLWLGVRADAVMCEYLISDAEVRRAFSPAIDDFVARGGDRAVFEPLMGVQPSYLDAAVDAMEAEYCSIECYFRDGLDLDAETLTGLRVRFLERV
jgi:protein-tyrosine phosphatase